MVDLPAPGEAGEPEHARLLAASSPARAVLSTSSACQWMFCARRSAKRSMPGADGVVGEPVDQDEAAGVAVLVVGVEGDRPVELEVADADLVQLERLRRRRAPAC